MNKVNLYFVLPMLIIAVIIVFLLRYFNEKIIDYRLLGLLTFILIMVFAKLKFLNNRK